ncbi:MAG: hypothetical protein IIB42_06570 [Candidatus Marinimicrobia bacterium]|nr:hypothetical protein [Candidatus Neomarinimicrobiota bacterium]
MEVLKTTFRFAFVLSLCVGVQITTPGCSKDEGPKGPDTATIGTVYAPTNDYRVGAVITGLGFFGCAQVTVEDGAGNLVTDATVEVNNQALVYDGVADAYTDEDEGVQLDYDEGEVYELTIAIGNDIIAEGIAQMPSFPTIISPVDSAAHLLNQALTVKTNAVKYATSVHVLVETPYIDAAGNWLDDTTYAFLVPSGSQEVTIPAWVFDVTGKYTLEVEAISGMTESFTMLQETGFEPDMGYNIRGPKGLFIAYAIGETQALFITSTISKALPEATVPTRVSQLGPLALPEKRRRGQRSVSWR